jgi:anti-sigma factor RsiW
MNEHEMVRARLDDLVDGLLDAAEADLAERHLSACDACRADRDAIVDLQRAARGLPRELVPPRDLWTGIAARIATERESAQDSGRVKVISIESGRRSRQAWWMRRDLLAAAALVLVLLSSAITATWIRSGTSMPGGEMAATTGPQPAAAGATSALVALEPTEQEIAGVVERLVIALEAQRGALDPATVAVVEENLRVIDGAIQEARAALEADPNNTDLTFLLMDVYRKKIDLLQNAVQISSI